MPAPAEGGQSDPWGRRPDGFSRFARTMNAACDRPPTSYHPAPAWRKKCFVGRYVTFGSTRYSPNRGWMKASTSVPTVQRGENV